MKKTLIAFYILAVLALAGYVQAKGSEWLVSKKESPSLFSESLKP